jgi:hypothetical protein
MFTFYVDNTYVKALTLDRSELAGKRVQHSEYSKLLQEQFVDSPTNMMPLSSRL